MFGFGCDCFHWSRGVSDFDLESSEPKPFSLPSPLPCWPQGQGFATGRINLGEIEVVKITEFHRVWSSDSPHGKSKRATIYRAEEIPKGFHCLGHYCQPTDQSLRGYILAARATKPVNADDPPPLKKPLSYSLVWSADSERNGRGYFWLPNPPIGYRAMGVVVTGEPGEPEAEEVRCVREDLTESCETSEMVLEVGSSKKSNRSGSPFSVWSIRPCERGMRSQGVAVGSFFCCTYDLSSGRTVRDVACLKNLDPALHAMPNLDQVHAVIEHYGPTVYFHPEESYMPSSVQWFFKNGALLYRSGKSQGEPINSTGSNLPVGGCNDMEFWIDLAEDEEAKSDLKKGNLESAELYVHVKPALGGTFTDIVMWIFCPFNGPATLKIGCRSNMDHDLDEKDNLRDRIKQLEHERNELQKDIEQLCMQQAGPSILGVATRMHFQRTASLEQEIESLKLKLAGCTREKHNLQEELAEAYRVKAQLAELHAGEVAKNLEGEKQLRFFQSSVAAAFSERDKSVMEAEKAKDNAEVMSQKLGEIETRLEELSSDCLVQKRLNDSLQADLAKLEEQTRTYAEVIEKFYDIRKDSLCESLEMSLHDKSASLLDDPKESWTFNDPSTSDYVAALEGELGKVKNTVDNLQSKLRVGLEIENHLKKRVRALEKKNIVADGQIVNGITDMRHHHSQLRAYIINLLNEEGLYIKSISKDLEEKIKLHSLDIQNVVPLKHDLKPDESECRDVHTTTVVESCQVTKLEEPNFAKFTAESGADASEAFAQALEEKVGALLLLSQQEERHLNEGNVNAALQQKVDELQRNVLQVTNEKVRTLLELARVRQEYQSLKDKMSGTREEETTESSGRIVISNEKEGRLKNMWKKSYINRWIDPSSREGGHSKTEADCAGNIDYASFGRMKVEYATLKESLESMGHLITSIRRLRLALLKVKESNDTETAARRREVAIANILVEATHLKTALGISIPISWSAESDIEPVADGEESSCEKTDSVSAAGFEMVELVILAADIMKEQQ